MHFALGDAQEPLGGRAEAEHYGLKVKCPLQAPVLETWTIMMMALFEGVVET